MYVMSVRTALMQEHWLPKMPSAADDAADTSLLSSFWHWDLERQPPLYTLSKSPPTASTSCRAPDLSCRGLVRPPVARFPRPHRKWAERCARGGRCAPG